MSRQAVVILGLARQGKALARFYAEQGWHVTVSDSRPADVLQAAQAELAAWPISYALGGHPESLLDTCDLLCLSGGVPAELPLVAAARARGIPVSNDAQEFLRRCPAPIVGITGSAGKTTTTALVGAMLREAGYTTWVGGNIGNPLISDLRHIRPTDRVVMELSSFQLELMTHSPQIAAVLNVTPNHLDRHKTMDAYLAAKRNIVAHQQPEDVAVLGLDDARAAALASATLAQIRYFSSAHAVAKGACLHGDWLALRCGGQIIHVCRRDEVHLRGAHNILNTLAAITLASTAGAPVTALRRAIAGFRGVEHRLEMVRQRRDVTWINDSMASAPERVLAALAAFDEPLLLLAGGRDKDLPWETWAQRVVERVRVLALFGEAQPMLVEQIKRVWQPGQPGARLERLECADTLERAVTLAAAAAQPGDVALLSPGGTSFDAYQDFAARGAHFRTLVAALED